ncbi:MaoC/PaaZ C-terminal domain-containing protein [Devosia sp. 1635]|uniref:MaoC/PaaZ C-terminal domain-containing protein n=1 Tax=Devosia sp. 1635 TaxID=2726066 RepID=UPI0015677DC2|nr:MaoC/PaaZ C-terminal domain-containing protein [Devosia sp. 1635]
MTEPVITSPRFWEDLQLGEVIELGRTTLTRDMITSFAREFDPFPFHLDESAAQASLLGGLAASGWQTGALCLRMLGDSFLATTNSAGIASVRDLKWKNPVMVGDDIGGTATIAELTSLPSQPELGIVALNFDVGNQKRQPVLQMRLSLRVATRAFGVSA